MYWLRTFGGFALERDGAPLDRIRVHRKVHGLLAVLAAQGTASRERLMALLWPESDTERAKGSLKQAVHLLRRQLGAPDLLLGTAELRLNPERIESDLNLFTRALDEGDLAAAVGHYTGPFLDGVHLDGTPEFERWVEIQRAELARRHMDALEQLARAAESQGDRTAAVGWWRRLQSADPLNGHVALSLMRALEASGDRAAALQHARAHETLLREEWGITPDPAIAALAERLRSSAAAPPRAGAPPPREAIAAPDPDTKTRAISEGEAAPAAASWPVEGRQDDAGTPGHSSARRPALLALAAILLLSGAAGALIGTRGGSVPGASEQRGTRSAGPGVPSPAPEEASLAVLPFADVSPQRDQEYFSDGMTEELISHLSKVEGLRVVARNSAFQFKGKHPDVRDAGERLGVVYVLEGSVRNTGDRLRISASLVSVETGYHLWSETYERSATTSDVFAVQEEISRAIAGALRLRLASSATAAQGWRGTGSLEAYQHYLKGRFFWEQRSPEALQKAVAYFEQAIAEDPGFAPAYAELARTYTLSQRSPPAPRFEKARELALRALALDSTLAAAHIAFAWIQMWYDRDWSGAERSLRRALELDPNYAWAHDWYGAYHGAIGRAREGFPALERAIMLDPLSPNMLTHLGTGFLWVGEYERAIEYFQKALELNPDLGHAHSGLARVHLQLGRYPEAIAALRLGRGDNYAGLRRAALLGYTFAVSGQADSARHVLEDLLREARTGYVPPSNVAIVYLGLGDRAQALHWLERVPDDRGTMVFLKADPIWDPLRSERRFQRVLRRMGLE